MNDPMAPTLTLFTLKSIRDAERGMYAMRAYLSNQILSKSVSDEKRENIENQLEKLDDAIQAFDEVIVDREDELRLLRNLRIVVEGLRDTFLGTK